jgi:hypothetical protein
MFFTTSENQEVPNSELLEQLSLVDATVQTTPATSGDLEVTSDSIMDSQTLLSMDSATILSSTIGSPEKRYRIDLLMALRSYVNRNLALVTVALSSFALMIFSVVCRCVINRLILRNKRR